MFCDVDLFDLSFKESVKLCIRSRVEEQFVEHFVAKENKGVPHGAEAGTGGAVFANDVSDVLQPAVVMVAVGDVYDGQRREERGFCLAFFRKGVFYDERLRALCFRVDFHDEGGVGIARGAQYDARS